MTGARDTKLPLLPGLVAGALCVGPAQAAEWGFAPNARVALDFVDNPRFLIEGGQSDLGTVGELSARLHRRTETLDITLAPLLRASRYRNDETLNNDDTNLDLGIEHRAERVVWSLDARFLRDSTLTSELGTTGRTQFNRWHQDLTLTGGSEVKITERLSAGVRVSWTDSKYEKLESSGLVDYSYEAVSLFESYALNGRTQLSLNASAGQLEVPSRGTTTRDGSLTLQFTHALSTRWTATVSAGPARVESDIGTDDGLIYGGRVERRGERLSLSADAGRSLTPTGRGVQTARDQIGVGLSWNMTERVNTRFSVHASRYQDLLPTGTVGFEEIEYGWIEGRFARRLSAQWTAALAVTATEQHNLAAPQSSQGYHVYLGLVWNGRVRTTSR